MKRSRRTVNRIIAVSAATIVVGGGVGVGVAYASTSNPQSRPRTTAAPETLTRGQANQMMTSTLRDIPPRQRAAAEQLHREMLPMMTGTRMSRCSAADDSMGSMMGSGDMAGSGQHG